VNRTKPVMCFHSKIKWNK